MTTEPLISRELVKRILVDEEGINSPDTATQPTAATSAPLASHPSLPHANGTALHSMDGLRPYARVRDDEGKVILQALEQHQGNKTRAAMSLGMTPRQLRYRIQKLQLDV